MRLKRKNPNYLRSVAASPTPKTPKRGRGAPRKAFTDEEKALIRRRYFEGVSTQLIATELHVGKSRVEVYLAESI